MRAQVSAFIIIGALLMVSAGIVFYALSPKSTLQFKSADVNPVRGYLDQCIANYIDQGISKGSLQGGIIYTDEDGQTPPFQPFNENDLFVTLSGKQVPVIVRQSGGDFFNSFDDPFVTYPGDRPFSKFSADMETYIENKLNQQDPCGVNSVFEASGISVTRQEASIEPRVSIVINGNEVFAEVFMPFEVKSAAETSTVSEFQVSRTSALFNVLAATWAAAEEVANDNNPEAQINPVRTGKDVRVQHSTPISQIQRSKFEDDNLFFDPTDITIGSKLEVGDGSNKLVSATGKKVKTS